MITNTFHMKTDFLLPHQYKKYGWILFIPALFAGVLYMIYSYEPSFLDIQMPAIVDDPLLGDFRYFSLTSTNAMDLILSVAIITGGLIVAFSKTEYEDEYIAKIRLESLVWAIIVNYMVLIFCTLFLYGFAFLYALVINMFTVLIVFIGRFHWKIHTMPGGERDEE